MIRFLLNLVIVFAALFAVLSITARELGATQPPNPALAGFTEGCEDKPQPCWYGIVPGVTTWGEVSEILHNIGYDSVPMEKAAPMQFESAVYQAILPLLCERVYVVMDCRECSIDGVVDHLGLNECDELALGSVPNWQDDSKIIVFQDGSRRIYSPRDNLAFDFEGNVSPLTKIDTLWINPFKSTASFKWHGFMPMWKYCQIEPEYDFCP